ncbi:MAG: hypothetical protein K0V04_41320, partial [Deltaproteobacteria bacterium]|nr:hypothetical protein [Deltaproteobacteria bacterium]
GQYIGSVLGSLARSLPPHIARGLHDDGRDPGRLDRIAKRAAMLVASEVHRHGYAGPVGIDGLLYRDHEQRVMFRPIVEVNVRPTMGHVAHGMARRVVGGAAGLWVTLRLEDLPTGGTLAEAITRARSVLPTELTGEPGRLRRGVVATTDPDTARSVGTVLLVGRRRADAVRALDAASPRLAARVVARLDGQ